MTRNLDCYSVVWVPYPSNSVMKNSVEGCRERGAKEWVSGLAFWGFGASGFADFPRVWVITGGFMLQ